MARGLAVFAALAALFVGGRVVYAQLAREAPRAPERCCAAPVEIVEDAVSRLGCAADSALVGCAGALAGDLVRVGSGSCVREAGGMRAALRLLSGLPLELNRVSAQDLEQLDGVGPSLAAQIVAERSARGRFARVEELREVRGVGEAVYARLAAHLEVSSPGEAP